MAGKRSTSKTKPKRNSLFSRLLWVIWTVVTGGSIAGWVAPNAPVVGPIVQGFLERNRSTETASDPTGNPSDSLLSKLEKGISAASGPATASIPGQVPQDGQRASASSSSKPANSILIASFNIQVFGTSKLAKPEVVDILARVVRNFDVVAIQEVRSKEDRVIPEFVAAVNADGSRYNFVIGPRLGRSVSTEQYVFVYDTNRIEIDSSSPGSIQDPADEMHREPFVARFRTRTQDPSRAFSFWLINAHTDPDEVKTEVNVLADVFQVMKRARPDEDDVILLGDLNASDRQFGRLGDIPGITWAVRETTTNTRRTKMYDNLLFDQAATVEYTGRWGVLDLESTYSLTREQALKVSDHLPVWAEFNVWETASQGNTARSPRGIRR